MKNEAFDILIGAEIVDERKLMDALRNGDTIRLNGPWEGSDYSGDEYTESNRRCLSRDFPTLLIGYDRPWGHCEYGLEIDPRTFGKRSNRQLAVELANTLAGLKEVYVVYDEEDALALIQERAEEAWGAYLRSDLESELFQLTHAFIDLDNCEEAFYELLSEHGIDPQGEGHRDVSFPGIDSEEFLRDLAVKALENGGLDPWTVEDLTDTGYEIVGAWMAEDFQPPSNQLTLF